MNILNIIKYKKDLGEKLFAVLVDPGCEFEDNIKDVIEISSKNDIDFIFVGGSLTSADVFDKTIEYLKKNTDIPIVLFPGNCTQLSDKADAILLLSLISGRNPDYLINNHINAAYQIKKSEIECISTAYILIESGKTTSVEYISNTSPIPSDKTEIVNATAIAGELIGMKMVYLEAGSGAINTVPENIINGVKKSVDCPIICGGGIRNAKTAQEILNAGADLIVVGNAAEKDPNIISEIAKVVKEY